MPLDPQDLASYRRLGHLTVNGVFRADEVDALARDIEAWGETFLRELPADKRAWYVDGGVRARTVLRKLDNPHVHRPAVQRLARDARLVALVEGIVGPGVSVYFSQVFFKAPDGGGPKPAHQDNFYFGPTDREGVVTAWIALDDATPQNGCLHFGEGTHLGPVHAHVAPPGEPFNLQLPPELMNRQLMTPAPVDKGGVSLHHGNTVHQSGTNRSSLWRRACALHYVRSDVEFATPALAYDPALKLRVS
jgi:ectoine hydroxylase-related dioxygenase (phytanoyl-CoA dioxygenase family)